MALCGLCGHEFKAASRRQLSCNVCIERVGDNWSEHGDTDGDGVIGLDGPITRPVSVGRLAPSTHLKFLCWPDTHFPYGDRRAISLGMKIVKFYQPDVVFLLGDMLDCTGFGTYRYRLTDPKSFLKTELDDWHEFATLLRSTVPKAELVYIEGNHEARVAKWVDDHPVLTGLPDMDLNNLLRLKDYGFSNDGKMVLDAYLANNEVIFTHGIHTGSNKAGFAARFEMARYGISGFTGHTHRLAQYFERSKRMLRVWHECGHMQEWQPHYLKAFPNWQQGLAAGEAARDGNDFYGEVVPFRTTYKARFGGKEFSS